MKIGIDITSLQGHHRMRGIGSVARNFLNNLDGVIDDQQFVFYAYKDAQLSASDVIESLELGSVQYEIRLKNPHIRQFRPLPGKLKYLSKLFTMMGILLEFRIGSTRYEHSQDLDVFLQLDQSEPVVRNPSVRNFFVAYDIIPYVLEDDYLNSYRSARHKGFRRLLSVRKHAKRLSYFYKIKFLSRKATGILSISESTKNDFVKHLSVKARKISVVSLGANGEGENDDNDTTMQNHQVEHYQQTSWGYIKKPLDLSNEKFLLFVGGVDPRRKVQDLVTAFNHLRAQGNDIKLVLTGDIMLGPNALENDNPAVYEALTSSSYLDDIFFLGYTDTKTRNWLYEHAFAFVFPSVYEGFGLPVLEVMLKRTPVISYEAAAIKEVASIFPFYCSDPVGLIQAFDELDAMPQKAHEKRLSAGFNHASEFDWNRYSERVLAAISKSR